MDGCQVEGCTQTVSKAGHASDPKYREPKPAKQAIYAKHGLRRIELGDAEIERLDDVLPRVFLRLGIQSV
jgi:hypothetical protein